MKVDMKDPSNWIPKDLFLSYCGEKSEKLSAFYDKAASKRNPMAWSVNWLAILLFPAWLGYRRQWVLFAVFVGMLSTLPIIEAVFDFSLPNGAYAGPLIAFGFMANGLLLSLANSMYLELRKNGLETTVIQEKMADRAKGSAGLAIVALVAYLLITMLAVYIADMIAGQSM